MQLSDILTLSTCLLGSFLCTYLTIPKIIGVVTYKRLMDNPNERSSHTGKIPSLGGIAFFMVTLMGFYFLQRYDHSEMTMALIPGLLILFITGLKDDLVVLGPITKLGAQFAAISFVLLDPAFQIRSLNNFMGIENISLYISIPLAAFVMLFIINAFNLIDGIDGLASMVGIVIFGVYSLVFYALHLYFFLGVSLLIIGSLVAFLRYNLSGTKKIFMGDTGSLIIGFLIAAATIRIFGLEPELLQKLPLQLENMPLVAMAILIVPVFDTARVFTVRLINGKRPFTADRNHIHHILMDYFKFSHRRTSIILGVANGIFVIVFIFLGINFTNGVVLGLMALCISAFIFFFYQINFSYKNLRRRINFKRKLKSIQQITNLFNF